MLAVAGASLWWVQHPPRSQDGYRERAAQTVESLRAYVETARLWSDQIARERAFRRTASVAFEEAAFAAQSTASRFQAWIPPRGTGGMRASVAQAASDVTAALGRLHVAAQRGHWRVVAAMRRELERLVGELIALRSESAA